MIDRIAEIREALSIDDPRGRMSRDQAAAEVVRKAAQERLEQLESNALIIRRDQSGEWDSEILHEFVLAGPWLKGIEDAKAFLSSLAASQGVD